MRLTSLALALVLASGCSADLRDLSCTEVDVPAGAVPPEGFRAVLDDATRSGLPGMVLQYQSPQGAFLGASGWADVGAGVAMKTCTRFRIASITKPFVAVTAMLAVEAGLLTLDDTLGQLLGDEARGLPGADSIRLRNLLQHTSGLPELNDQWALERIELDTPTRVLTLGEAIDLVRGVPADFPAGDRYAYSNTNYVMVGRAVERAFGEPLADLLQAKLFDPLGLSSTSYGFSPLNLSRGYVDLYRSGPAREWSGSALTTGLPSAGIVSTTQDLTRFALALFEGALLKPESLAAMEQQTVLVSPTQRAGLGLFRRELEGAVSLGHTGEVFGFESSLAYYPQQRATVVLWTNGSLGRFDDLFAQHSVGAVLPLVLDGGAP